MNTLSPPKQIDDRDRVILACVRAGLPVKTITTGTGLGRATVLRRIKAIKERVKQNQALVS